MSHRCYIVPPFLLKAISESPHNSDAYRQAAREAHAFTQGLMTERKNYMKAKIQSQSRSRARPRAHPFVPSYMLRNLSQSEHADEETRAGAAKDLALTLWLESPESGEEIAQLVKEDGKPPKESPHRSVYDAGHVSSETELPGKLVRTEGDKEAKDKAVNEAYDNVGTVLEFYKEKFKWNSIDNKNVDVISSVHFGEQYENACKCL